jgi:hypothetical protein
VPTVLFVVAITIVTITVTSTCICLCTTTKKVQSSTNSDPSTGMSAIYNQEINNGTKDKSSCETDFQDEHIYVCL